MEIKILRKIINDTKKIDAIQRNELSNRSLYSLQRDIDNNFGYVTTNS